MARPPRGRRAAGRARGELDPAAGLAAALVAHDREPVRVARVRGSALPLVANLLPGRALIAEALGIDEAGLGALLAAALEAPVDPVDDRPAACQEVVVRDPDLARLPIPRFFEHEGGPYITAGCIVARDPETGERNWSIARVRPLGGSRALVGIAPNHHLAVAARAARERGRRLPIAVTVGNHPALMLAACLYLARGEDELRIAGALLGEPVELAACTHVPLEVPAGCELVLEGELDLDATVDEGPVSEFHGGYERYGSAATATFQRLTRRRDAIYQAILPGFHPEHALLGGVAIAAGLERRLRAAVPSVRAVAVPESGAGRLSGRGRARRARARRRARPRRSPRSRPSTSSSSSRSSTTTSIHGTTRPSRTRSRRASTSTATCTCCRACAPTAPSRSSATARSRSSRSTPRARPATGPTGRLAVPPR